MNKDTLDKLMSRLDSLSTVELRQLFLRLASDRGLLQDVFDALRDGLILFDAEGQARYANKMAEKIYNRPLRDLLREPFERLNGGTCRWEDLQGSGAVITRDLQVNYPEPRHYNLLMSPVAQGSEYLLLIHDDTELLARREASAEAEQLNLLTFLSGAVAHEIGNPLNSLGLNLQLMRRKLAHGPEDCREALEPLLDSALAETRRLDGLLRHFLQSMRPGRLQREPVQVNEVIRNVLATLAPEIAPRGVAVQESYCRDLPLIEADPKRLFQVFYNLIRNAYQSIPGPDGCILVLTGYNDTDVRICISDTGTGISHEVMGNMYEPFHTTKKHGNGLGLLIVRHIVREHGGTLGIASREGQGTAVTVTLPRADRVVRLLPQ